MKKLLILVLVLGLSTVASAALQLSVNGVTGAGVQDASAGDVIGVVSDDTSGYDYYLTVALGVGTYGDFGSVSIWQPHADGGHAGGDAAVTDYTAYYTAYFDRTVMISAKDVSSPFDIAAGTQFSMPILAGATTGFQIDLMDDALTILDSVYVPEPMTIALLGLGGLFLRRRK